MSRLRTLFLDSFILLLDLKPLHVSAVLFVATWWWLKQNRAETCSGLGSKKRIKLRTECAKTAQFIYRYIMNHAHGENGESQSWTLQSFELSYNCANMISWRECNVTEPQTLAVFSAWQQAKPVSFCSFGIGVGSCVGGLSRSADRDSFWIRSYVGLRTNTMIRSLAVKGVVVGLLCRNICIGNTKEIQSGWTESLNFGSRCR